MANKVRMWVHPDFKKTIKKKAVDSNLNVIAFTEKLAKDSRELESKFIKGLKKINENWSKLL